MFLEVKPRTRKPPSGSVVVDTAQRGVAFAVPLDEGGGPIRDVARGFLGALIGSTLPNWVTTVEGIALNFAGSGGCRVVFNNPGSAFQNSFTRIARIRLTDTSTPRTISASGDSFCAQWRVENGGQPSLLKSDAVYIGNGTIGITANTWVTVALTYDGTTARFYHNGVPNGSAANAQTFTNTTLILGGRTSGGTPVELFQGQMAWYFDAERMVYSPSEIAAFTYEPYAFLKPKLYPFFSFPLGPLGGANVIAIGQASETDLAQSIAHTKLKALGQLIETDLAQPISHTTGHALGQATETDMAFALTRVKQRVLGVGGLALETDLSQPVAKVKTKTIGQAQEFDLAQKVTAVGGFGGGAGPGRGSGILRTIRG